MAQIEFESLTNEWTALSDIITVSADTTYYIQSRGNDILVALEATTKPEQDNQAGVLIYPKGIAVYKKGTQDLYLRAFNKSCTINITSEG